MHDQQSVSFTYHVHRVEIVCLSNGLALNSTAWLSQSSSDRTMILTDGLTILSRSHPLNADLATCINNILVFGWPEFVSLVQH